MKYLFPILFILPIFGQTIFINEIFSDMHYNSGGNITFSFSTDSLKHIALGDSVQDEITGGGEWVWNNSDFPVYSQFNLASPIYANSQVVQFDGSNDNFNKAAGATGHLNPNLSGQFSIAIYARPGDVTKNWCGILNKNETASQKVFWIGQHANDGWVSFGMYLDNSTETRFDANTSVTGWANNTWHKLVFTYDGDKQRVYFDGVLISTSASRGSGQPAGTSKAYISTTGAAYFPGYIAQIVFADTVWGLKEVKEFGNLAWGWLSKNGGVTRNGFNQGIIADTVYHAIGAAGTAAGRVDAWGASGGETLKVFNKAGDSQNFVLTTDSTRYTISSIIFAASDSIYFSAGAGETSYIDNVYLETAPAVAAVVNIYSNNFTGFPEFPDFINDEAIQ